MKTIKKTNYTSQSIPKPGPKQMTYEDLKVSNGKGATGSKTRFKGEVKDGSK